MKKINSIKSDIEHTIHSKATKWFDKQQLNYIYPDIKRSIESINNYSQDISNKSIKKIKNSAKYHQFLDSVSEILVLGYFINKFKKNKEITIEYERKTNGNKNIDISIINLLEKNVNIEVITLHHNQSIQQQRDNQVDQQILFWQNTTNYSQSIKSKIKDKLESGQIPKNEYNFVWVVNDSTADEIDFEWVVNTGYTPDNTEKRLMTMGLPDIIKFKNYPEITGIIYSRWDVNKNKYKKIIQNLNISKIRMIL